METRYEKFEQIVEDVNKIQSLITYEVFQIADMPNFLDDKSEEYMENLYELIYKVGKLLSEDLVTIEFISEVDFNIAGMENDGKVMRYLLFIKNRLTTLYETCASFLTNDLINTKYSGKIVYEQTLLGNVVDNERTYYRFTDPVMALKVEHLSAVEKLQNALDYINDKIDGVSSLEKKVESLYELKLDRHRLILLQKTGVFKFLCDKYVDPSAPLMIKEKFQRLIANMIGATTKEIGSDVSKLLSENTDPKKPKTVQTTGSTNAVNAFLTSLGLPR
jgi:hypothetical protein